MDNIQRGEQMLRTALAELPKMQTYSCVVICQDRIDGKLRPQERILSYFKAPRSVYLRWLPGPYEGLQASFVPERDGEGKFMARETGLKGLAGAMSWPYDSPMVTKMYPHHFRTHETSVHFLVTLATEIALRAQSMGKLQIITCEDTTDPLLKRPAILLESQLSNTPSDGLRWPKTEFWFDQETKLPLHFKLHAFDGGLFGEYAFSEFKPNAVLSPDCFELKKL